MGPFRLGSSRSEGSGWRWSRGGVAWPGGVGEGPCQGARLVSTCSVPLNPGLVRAVNCLMHILALSPGMRASEAAAPALERMCISRWSLFWARCLPVRYVRDTAFSTSRLSVGGPHFALLFWALECL